MSLEILVNKKSYVAAILFVLYTLELNAHDTFLKFDTHFIQPQTKASAFLFNGSFDSSENSVALERMRDVRITGPSNFLQRPDSSQWRLTKELNKLDFTTGATGTYIVGVSITPRTLEMTSEKFNSYLEHDGVLDILKTRQKGEQAERAVTEKYSKHFKALFQVGENRTDSFGQIHGFPIEIVPQENPFSLSVGETLPVVVLSEGKPVKNQLMYASYAGFHRHDDGGKHVEAVQTRTDSKGVAEIKIDKKGLWYVRLIHMVPSAEEGVDYESNWATLTFEIK